MPACKQNSCEACMSDADCIRKNETAVIFLDIGQALVTYAYEAIGTNITAVYDINQTCYVSGIYSNASTHEECEAAVMPYVTCDGGECKAS